MLDDAGQLDALDALVTASKDREPTESVIGVWRRLTPDEQETVLFELLGMQKEAVRQVAHSEGPVHSSIPAVAPTAATMPSGDTELIPKPVEDLRSLSASQADSTEHAPERPEAWVSDYWSRWIRRWKVSALVAAWAVTTTFAFTTDTRSFGPTEWVVAVFGSAVLGGLSAGTLLNFAVAALPMRTQRRADQ